jgi:hypothetical protein
MASNPFKYAGPLGDDDIFVGRETEIRKIIDLISRSQPVAIYGERRIGKTSLLYRLKKELAGEKVAYISFEEIRDDDEFLKWLAKVIGSKDWSTPIDLVPFLEKQKPVLLLDEFDKTAFSEQFNSDFFHLLRAWASQGLVKLVVASLRKPSELLSQSENITSPFYNIFYGFEIGPLDRPSAEKLLARLDKNIQHWRKTWKQAVLKATGQNPWKLQNFGHAAWEMLEDDPSANLETVLASADDAFVGAKSLRPKSGKAPVGTVWYKALPPQIIAGVLALGSFLALGGLLTSSVILSILGVIAILLAAIALIIR